MSNSSNYNPDDELLSPWNEAIIRVLNSPSIADFVPTPAGMIPSNHSSLSSPPQSTTLSDIFPFDDLLYDFNDDKLMIIAEPKAFYRERYYCETDPKRNRAQRYIRTEHGSKYEHPTIKIPSKWRLPQIYIRVTSVTIKNKNAPYHCIHPYEIDTQEKNVISDKDNNSLYFPVYEHEMNSGEKSFLISRTKMTQNELKSYGPFRLFDSNQPDSQRVQDPQDAKQKIAVYQLWKSQLVFTIAEVQNNSSLLVPIFHTSVTSRITAGETVVTSNSPKDQSNMTSIHGIKCIPQQSNWAGGDEIVIIMPNPIKRKKYTICFDFGQYGQEYINEIIRIDTKTILFRTPSCPILLPGDENLKISIIIQENESIISPIDFYYITPIKTTINICSHCRGNVRNNPINNKRGWEDDNGEHLISQMDQLSIEQETQESHSRISSNENNSKVDKYLYQLKDTLEIFVRTNNPSRLFRRTRILLTKRTEDSSPLNDAIQHGHTQLALSLIEQIIDIPSPNSLLENENENGETPLLIAAKLNEWKLIESILKNRSDLARKKDKNGNNLFHLLANLSEDKGVETIENVLKILPNDIKNILKEQNKINQTPIDIAQSNGNTQCMNLLIFPTVIGKN